MNKNHLRGSLCCVLAARIWGVAFVAQAAGMDHVGPFTFLGLRCWLAAAVLASLPILLLYMVLQKQIIDSFMKSGIK